MNKIKFQKLINADAEHEHLEFKEASKQFNFENGKKSLLGYCIALANEKGGKIILGVSDKMPRKVIGTKAYRNIIKLEKKIFQKLKRRVRVEEYFYNKKRILIFDVPSRPIAEPLEYDGMYLKRVCDELVSMTPDQLREIQKEAISDYSSTIINGISLSDLSQDAIKELRILLKQSGRVNKEINIFSDKQLLIDLNLINKNKFTLASLLLLGTEKTLSGYLSHSEVRYGYRISESEIRNQDVQIYKEGYLSFYKKIWDKINSKNLFLTIPEGLIIKEKRMFEEETIREAINNAIIHRDYSEQESIIIEQTKDIIKISSPGGLLSGITIKNMIDRTKTRNKLVADVLYKCGFVESFGHGVNLMVKNQLSLGKEYPNYTETDNYHVVLKINGNIKDPEFTKYVYRITHDLNKTLNDEELRVLYSLKDSPQKCLSGKIGKLLDIGIVEKTSRGKYMLSRKYYDHIDKKAEYTRRKGLDKQTNIELIIKHLEHYKKGYISEFTEVLKDIPKPTINRYLNELKRDGKIDLVGNPKISKGENKAYWKLKK